MLDIALQNRVLITAIVGAVATYYIVRKFHKKALKWEKVGRIKQLIIYPVKSARGIEVTSAVAGPEGLCKDTLIDRSFVVYTQDGVMVTGRTAPSLTTLTPTVNGNTLVIKDLSGSEVTVDLQEVIKKNIIFKMRMRERDSRGLDCGETVSEWLTQRLFPDKRNVRLLFRGKLDVNRIARKPKYFDFKQFKSTDKINYSDTAAYMVQTKESLDDLNSRLETPVHVGWYRPTIFIEGPLAWDEDNWGHIRIGERVILRAVKPCERCYLTTISPDDGKHNPEALNVLKSFRVPKYPLALASEWKDRPLMGVQCSIDKYNSIINVGDDVWIARHVPIWKK